MQNFENYFGKCRETKESHEESKDFSVNSLANSQILSKKDELRSKMGNDVFDYYYHFLY